MYFSGEAVKTEHNVITHRFYPAFCSRSTWTQMHRCSFVSSQATSGICLLLKWFLWLLAFQIATSTPGRLLGAWETCTLMWKKAPISFNNILATGAGYFHKLVVAIEITSLELYFQSYLHATIKPILLWRGLRRVNL